MDEALSNSLKVWQKLKEEIKELHQHRQKKGTAEATKKGLEIFIQFLCLSNDKHCCPLELLSFSDLEIKPVNVRERIDFIITRPGLFPSYIQLCELMLEQEKLFAKKNAFKKTSRP